MAKTFEPRPPACSAREKKLAFLSSDVLPVTQYEAEGGMHSFTNPKSDPLLHPADEVTISPTDFKQNHLTSQIFDRETPLPSKSGLKGRLTPSSANWQSVVEPAYARALNEGGPSMRTDTARERSYREKSSSVFGHETPARGFEQEPSYKMRNSEEERIRHGNAYYSDIHGHGSILTAPTENRYGEVHRPKPVPDDEHKVVVHSDWRDSRTELVAGSKRGGPGNASTRKKDELHQSRIFANNASYDDGFGHTGKGPNDYLEPFTVDNSNKVKNAQGKGNQNIHQAHLRTSMTPDSFYESAEGAKHWEVTELHLSGLSRNATDATVKEMCQGTDLQIVKVSTETDPINNLCKGRAKVMVRYNPNRDSIDHLVGKLQDTGVGVE